jgi:hypothetical protein
VAEKEAAYPAWTRAAVDLVGGEAEFPRQVSGAIAAVQNEAAASSGRPVPL